MLRRVAKWRIRQDIESDIASTYDVSLYSARWWCLAVLYVAHWPTSAALRYLMLTAYCYAAVHHDVSRSIAQSKQHN